MRYALAALLVLVLGGLTPPARLHAGEPPLPEGAAARLGSTTFRTSARAVCLSPDGKRLATHTYYNQGELVLFELGRGDATWRQTFKLDDAVGGLAFTHDGAVVTAHPDGTVRGWKAADGARTLKLRGPAGYLWCLQLTADGKLAVTDAPGATALV